MHHLYIIYVSKIMGVIVIKQLYKLGEPQELSY